MEKTKAKAPDQRIRNIDPDLYHLARVEAVKERKPIGVWISEAIKLKLEAAK